jgi:hypothetical protein
VGSDEAEAEHQRLRWKGHAHGRAQDDEREGRTTTLVNGLADDVHDATEARGADGNGDGSTSVDNLGAADLLERDDRRERQQLDPGWQTNRR